MTTHVSNRRKLRTAAVVACISLAVSACGGAQSEDGDQSDSSDWRAKADHSAVLNAGMGLAAPFFSGLDPARSLVGCDVHQGRLIYGALTTQTKDGPAPWLAESWEVVDPTTLELTIRDGVTFHNGKPFDAEAVKWGLDRNREAPGLKDTLSAIKDIEVVDDRTLRITMTRPAAGGLLATFSGREGLIVERSSVEDGSVATKPIGAGPFMVSEFAAGEALDLRRYENYYDPDQFPYAGIDFTHVTDEVSLRNAVLAGDLDIAFSDQEGMRALASNPNTDVMVNPTASGFYVNLNTSLSNPPLDDLKVRQALNHAFDRESAARALFGENGAAKWQLFPEGYLGHDPDLEESYPYDPEKARELLAEAGYPDGFKMTMQAFAAPNPSARSAEILKANLADVGVELTIVTGSNITQDYHIDKKTDSAQNWWIPRTDPSLTPFTLYGPAGIINTSGYENAELDKLVFEAQGATDPSEINRLLQEASKIIVDEAREIGVAWTPAVWGYRTDRVGFKDGQLRDYGGICSGLDYSSFYLTK